LDQVVLEPEREQKIVDARRLSRSLKFEYQLHSPEYSIQNPRHMWQLRRNSTQGNYRKYQL